jgi:tetratricopeptide (TPR) repeat protein
MPLRPSALALISFFLVSVLGSPASARAPRKDRTEASVASPKAAARSQTVKRLARYEQLKQRGKALERAGDMDGALDAYKAALMASKDPVIEARVRELSAAKNLRLRKQSDDIYLRALKAAQIGNDARAREHCRDALALDPGNIHAKRMLARLEKRNR